MSPKKMCWYDYEKDEEEEKWSAPRKGKIRTTYSLVLSEERANVVRIMI